MQYDLYSGIPPHVQTDTSICAALEAPTNLRQKVFEHIKSAGEYGRTDLEMEDLLGMIGSTVRPRRRELFLIGKVKDSGLRRKTPSGRYAIVWIAT